MPVTHHMHLLDVTPIRHSDAAIDNVNDLLNPWAIPSQVVQDVPILRYSSCPLFVFGSCAVATLWMPPAAPARVVRFASAFVS